MIKTVSIDNVISRELLENKLSIPAGMNMPKMTTDGAFIMFHRKSDNYPLIVSPDRWPSFQNNGEIADGAAVVEGGKILVVGPTETTSLYWSSAAVSGGGTTTSDRINAMNDWSGKANTASQITKPECQVANYAPGFCAQYSRANANGKGLTAGKWWLPALGEMLMIYANMAKINYALSFIAGAAPLTEELYWSSTEAGETGAWYILLGNGYIGGGTKNTNKIRTRPVSAFIA
ncbi:MAG: hypothetical protein HUK10_03770 [Bacteroides heparinolyticus]|nr:hypothetical protein [Bacteroides heparinolyticus]